VRKIEDGSRQQNEPPRTVCVPFDPLWI